MLFVCWLIQLYILSVLTKQLFYLNEMKVWKCPVLKETDLNSKTAANKITFYWYILDF